MKSYIQGSKNRSWAKIWLITGLVILAILAGSVFFIRRSYNAHLMPVSASQKSILVTVPSGSTVSEISNLLQKKGLIRASWAFEWFVRNNDERNNLQAGTYSLRPNQSVQEIINVLTHGKVATDLFTILPAQRLDQIRAALINNGGYSAAEVDKALEPSQYLNSPALSDLPAGASLEGYLYPESFQKTADTTPETIIRASLDEMQKHLTPDTRTAFNKKGLTVHEGVILASIIEQEVSNKNDKPTVAQVFLLRRSIGMEFGSDVTAFYGAIKDGQTPSVSYDSPYNTRLHPGFPPGPIGNVSGSSLMAVAFPASTDYLFFVAGDDGRTYFSRTLAEHDALVSAHCKKLCQ